MKTIFSMRQKSPATQFRSPGSPRTAEELAFWNCRLTKREKNLLVAVTVLAAALHLAPVLNSGLGKILTYAVPVIAYLSPFTAFFFFACNQFLPFPEGSTHNPAQAGVLVWLPMALLVYHRVNLQGVWKLWPVLPWLCWYEILTRERIYLPNSDYVKALVYSVIACQMANESRGQFLKCLLGLSFGALLVMTAYWASQLGLPVEVCDWGGDREGFARLGSVRADAVMVWPALLIGMAGLLGVQIAFASRRSPRPSPLWLTYATLILSVISLPPLVSTMSHGAFAGFALMAVAVAWAAWMAGKGGAFANARFQILIKWGAVGIATIIALFVVDAFQMRTKVISLDTYYKNATEETGLAASRAGVWHDSMHTILKYPVLGIRVTGDQEEITSGYAARGTYESHNVFLDYGRSVGIPGMLLLIFFFFHPAVVMWRRGDRIRYLPFLLAHFAMLIFWMSLSFQFYKTFWVLWMLMALAASSQGVVRAKISLVGRVRLGSIQRRGAVS